MSPFLADPSSAPLPRVWLSRYYSRPIQCRGRTMKAFAHACAVIAALVLPASFAYADVYSDTVALFRNAGASKNILIGMLAVTRWSHTIPHQE